MPSKLTIQTVFDNNTDTNVTAVLVNGAKFCELEEGSYIESLLVNLAETLGCTVDYLDRVIE